MSELEKIKEEKFQPYIFNMVTNQYTTSQKVKVEKGCNSFQVTNLGTCVVKINKTTLFPSTTPATVAGDSISLGGNLGEVYKGNLDLIMVLPLGATPLVEITQKYYTLFEL